jgi:hypothetical protein
MEGMPRHVVTAVEEDTKSETCKYKFHSHISTDLFCGVGRYLLYVLGFLTVTLFRI